jgi:hypothetical protein
MFHVGFVYDMYYSTTTFIFNMVWNDTGFGKCHMCNIATNIGTPFYWYGRTTPDLYSIDEKIIENI